MVKKSKLKVVIEKRHIIIWKQPKPFELAPKRRDLGISKSNARIIEFSKLLSGWWNWKKHRRNTKSGQKLSDYRFSIIIKANEN
jgi:hypothetical protein